MEWEKRLQGTGRRALRGQAGEGSRQRGAGARRGFECVVVRWDRRRPDVLRRVACPSTMAAAYQPPSLLTLLPSESVFLWLCFFLTLCLYVALCGSVSVAVAYSPRHPLTPLCFKNRTRMPLHEGQERRSGAMEKREARGTGRGAQPVPSLCCPFCGCVCRATRPPLTSAGALAAATLCNW